MAFCAASSRRSAPVAATSAMAMAIEVSSVHSPGAQPNPPPPTIATSFSLPRAGWNSYGAPSASPAAVASSTPHARSIRAVVNAMSFPFVRIYLRNNELNTRYDRGPTNIPDPRDGSGRTLADYPRPSVAVDTALLTLDSTASELHVLQVRRNDDTGWALPGTFLHPGERLADAVDRSLRVKAGVRGFVPANCTSSTTRTATTGAGCCRWPTSPWSGRTGWRRDCPNGPG